MPGAVPEGRAGLAYGSVPRNAALTGTSYLLGLRQNDTDRANVAEDLNEFFGAVHNIVSELMDAKNLFIALQDKKTRLMSYPYFVDEHDPIPEADTTPQRGLTEYVLRADRPVLVHADMMKTIRHLKV